MKRIHFLLLLFSFVSLSVIAQSEKAIYCEGNTTLYFLYDSETYEVDGIYDGQTVTAVFTGFKDKAYHPDAIPWASYRSVVTSVKITDGFQNCASTTYAYWFYMFTSLKTVDGCGNLNVSEATTLQGTFQGCSELTTLDLGGWNTKKIKTLSETFRECKKLESLDVSSWVFENLANLYCTFYYCNKINNLDVSKWDVSKVTTMSTTFAQCTSLTALDVSKWDTGNVTTMYCTFQNCSKLSQLDVSNWNTENVANMGYLFSGCSALQSIDVGDWKTANVTNLNSTFSNCSLLRNIEIDNWNIEKVTNLNSTFSGCKKLETLNVSKWNTSNVINMYYTFANCNVLQELNVSKWNTEKLSSFGYIFSKCSALSSLDVSNWNTAKVTYMTCAFQECRNLTSLTFGKGFSKDGLSGAGNAQYMFQNCSKLRYIDFYESDDIDAVQSSYREATFAGVPLTTVVYLPHGSKALTDATNVVYTDDDGTLKCPYYYSEDKVDIEFPRDFQANKAEYSRTMSNTYGTVVLPYDFSTNSDIQAYTLDEEHTETMYFVDAATVSAHTPFAFKRLGSAKFVMEDATGGFGITVHATHDTEKEGPYESPTNLGGWTARGYYINQTVSDYADTYYIASDKFCKADGALTMTPHRATFYSTEGWTKGDPTKTEGARVYAIATLASETDVRTAIEAADARRTMSEAKAEYDLQGRRVSGSQRGLSIVRMADGSVRKVVR